ncbi:MAG: DNA-3-methyladenine glycosylase 2 family protein [Planctomycetes bacterium]|nr:DNA-3-methyladenine glycosylase 2 family protein [Planctomycetota bacterium]
MSTPFYKKVRRHLSDNCPVMNRLIARVGPCTLVPRGDDPFTLLVRCVISQQISTKAAESISGKLVALLNDGAPTGPIPFVKLAKLTEAKYKACGISGPKQRTLRAVVDHVRANPTLLSDIPALADDAIRTHLTAIKGIGPWTADMFLLFGMGRPDVWAVGDYGIQVAVKTLFNLRKVPDAARLAKIARPWEPYRSVASWYLWRSLDPRYKEADE